MPWEDYIEQRVLKPLGMEHTMVRQPTEDELPADLSKGYKWEDDHLAPKGFEYVPAAPAGCISTTAADAARFMIAHLNDGKADSGRILKPETARRMREPLFQHDPRASAMCYGFIEGRLNGKRFVGHAGDTLWFHSLLELMPTERVGLFVSYNTDTSSSGVRESLLYAFLQRYFPEADRPQLTPTADARARAPRLAGEYMLTRYSHSTVAKLGALLGVVRVSANDDGTITIKLGRDGGRFVEVEPDLFQQVDGTDTVLLDTVVFREGSDGRGEYLFPVNLPPFSFQRRSWYDTRVAHLSLLGASIAVFVTALLFWPVIAFSVRGLSAPQIKRTRFSGVLSCVGWLLSAASLALAGGLALTLEDPDELVFGLPSFLKGLLALTPVCAVLAAITVIACVVAWWQRYWRLSGRLHYTLVALAGMGFTFFLYYWNLLS
jgi:hypothetical protein